MFLFIEIQDVVIIIVTTNDVMVPTLERMCISLGGLLLGILAAMGGTGELPSFLEAGGGGL